MSISRRRFLGAGAAVSAGFLGLRRLLAGESTTADVGYGGLVADPRKTLDLPRGFSYREFGRVGERMDDGFAVPGAHDGMAAFPGPDGRTILIRNHELDPGGWKSGPFGSRNELFRNLDPALLYDPGDGRTYGPGGTTTAVYDTRSQSLERQFLSLAGTIRNCAGGPTPWNSWVSCEETIAPAGKGLQKEHGYCFEVPATADPGLALPVPLKAMGRFYHEAVAVDPASGVVYETEDKGDGLFYRFLPLTPGKLALGGKLQALKVRDKAGMSTANHGKGSRIEPGTSFEVDWIDLDNVESPKDDLRQRGAALGAATFSRGEGMWFGRGAVYFACTSGGRNRKGQIWRYHPSPDEGTPEERRKPGRLELFIEPNDPTLLENADNMTVTPWGDLLVCENGKAPNQVVGVTPEGKLYTLARNTLNSSEFAGVTVSPDGSTVFVNIQKPGVTIAITGPWRK